MNTKKIVIKFWAGPPPVLPKEPSKNSPIIIAPLRSIFDNDHVEKIPNGLRSKMKCLWCGFIWPDAHATRMIGHLPQRPGMHIKPCLGKIDEHKKRIYQELFDRKNSSKAGKKRVHEDSAKLVEDSLSSLAQALVASRSPPLSCPPPWLKDRLESYLVLTGWCRMIFEGAMMLS